MLTYYSECRSLLMRLIDAVEENNSDDNHFSISLRLTKEQYASVFLDCYNDNYDRDEYEVAKVIHESKDCCLFNLSEVRFVVGLSEHELTIRLIDAYMKRTDWNATELLLDSNLAIRECGQLLIHQGK